LKTQPKATGDCFENCGKYITGASFADMTLVHATVVGTGSEVKGISYAHAFLIAEDRQHAIDLTKDLHMPIVVPLDYYRQLGNVSNEICYTRKEAVAEIKKSGHWGPWTAPK
jgi:hypothetical protein